MNEQQHMEFGRFDTLTGNASGVFGHQMVGDRLYTSAVDNSVRLWDLRSLQVKSKIVGHSDFVRALATAGESNTCSVDFCSECRKVTLCDHWQWQASASLPPLTIRLSSISNLCSKGVQLICVVN